MSNGRITDEQARAARLEYYREWRRRNPDKIRAQNKRYWEKQARKRLDEQAQAEQKGAE